MRGRRRCWRRWGDWGDQLQTVLGFAYWRLFLAGLATLVLLFLSTDFLYRKTLGQEVLQVRVSGIQFDKLLTDKGEFALRGYSRRYYGRTEVKSKLRVGCKYNIALSMGFLATLSSYVDGNPKMPFVERIGSGIEEPALGCTNLYNSVSS